MKRVYEKLLNDYLGWFPCVAIQGPRQCGKTTFLNSLPAEWKVYDLEKQSDYQIVAQDPDLFFRLNPSRVAVDEAQLLPRLFSALRSIKDFIREHKCRFGLVINNDEKPRLLSNAIAGIPVACL